MKPKYLTLEEIEQCANNIVKEVDLSSTIRDKFRYLSAPLICRYAYYTIAREQMSGNRKAHSLQSIGSLIGFNHSTVINGIGALASLVASKKEGAPELFARVIKECDEFLKNKYETYELNIECKSLLIGLYAA